MGSTHLALPTKACHNCRKRRWKCDRSLPVCQKCLSSGSECLGYGKLFVWNQGVASRGKMMGKSYDANLSRDMETKKEAKPQALQWQPEPSQPQPLNFSDAQEPNGMQEDEIIELPNHQELEITVPSPLVDPLFKDLNPHSRYYLFHFATQLCGDMVTYDGPGKNPIRDLIPATSAYPLLLHIIEANSAFHVFNISRDPMSQSAYQQQEQRPCLVAYYKAVSRFGGPLKSSYHDALIAKQQALSLLAQHIASVKPSNIDLILVTILLFINYALIESGRDKWKIHMDGARRLIGMLGDPPYLQNPMTTLRQTILSDFLVFHILGSTLCFTTMPKLIPDSIELEPILRYAETNNYLSCPGPLLRIMNESFNLCDTRVSASDEISVEMQEQIGALLKRTLEFDPVTWASDFQPASPLDDIELRVRMASAHRSAVCIYLARVLPCTNPLLDPSSGSALVSLTGLADDIVHHISCLKPGDVLFKSICWPLFLAGAESEDPAQREWIMNTLDTLHYIMYWGYIPTVKRVLDAIWKCKDKAAVGADNCWVVEVKELTDILIV